MATSWFQRRPKLNSFKLRALITRSSNAKFRRDILDDTIKMMVGLDFLFLLEEVPGTCAFVFCFLDDLGPRIRTKKSEDSPTFFFFILP